MPARRRGGKGSPATVHDVPKGSSTPAAKSKQDSQAYLSLVAVLKQRDSLSTGLYPIFATMLMGLVFGFALNKGRVAEPVVITDQFKFARWTMMKMFLAAAGTSAIVLSVLAATFRDHFRFMRTKHEGTTNVVATALGGFILGSGMAIGGACPGMVLIQVGAGVPNSVLTLLGALTGAFVYGLTEPLFRSLFSRNHLKGVEFLDHALGVNFSLLAFIFGTLLLLFALFLERLFPWESELIKANVAGCNWLECRSWSPILSGVLVGLVQIPCVLVLGNTLGGASSYVCVTGQWIRFVPESVGNYFSHFKGSLTRFWQVLYVTSAILGSVLAVFVGGGTVSSLPYEPFDGIQGMSEKKAFLGGFMMLAGARLAKGCTSGHGLSGMGVLNVASMICVAAMFAGGGIVGLILEYVLQV